MRVSLCLLPLALAACASSPDPAPQPPAPVVPRAPWTTAFADAAILLAEEIVVEGPDDLLEHFVNVRADGLYEHSTRTTEYGRLLETRLAEGVHGAEIRAYLDAWELVAMRKLTVLQRPGEVAVTVRARGKAWWSPADGSGERRGDDLAFRGARGE